MCVCSIYICICIQAQRVQLSKVPYVYKTKLLFCVFKIWQQNENISLIWSVCPTEEFYKCEALSNLLKSHGSPSREFFGFSGLKIFRRNKKQVVDPKDSSAGTKDLHKWVMKRRSSVHVPRNVYASISHQQSLSQCVHLRFYRCP